MKQQTSDLLQILAQRNDEMVSLNINETASNQGTYGVAVVANNEEVDEKLGISGILNRGYPLVMTDVNSPETLAELVGIGVSGQVIVLKPYDDFLVMHVLGKEGPQEMACSNGWSAVDDGQAFEKLNVHQQADMVEAILRSEIIHATHDDRQKAFGALGNGLPLNQYKLVYVVLESKWNLTDSQLTDNSVVMEVSLFASFNPQYKYLRIQSMGAGFSPGTLTSNSTYDRGYFQSSISIHIAPTAPVLTVLSTEPKNINRQTTYIAGSSFSVGVDISKNPSFSPSYTVSQSQTVQISDFNVYNNSAGKTADWEFKMSAMEDDVWKMFSNPFLAKPKVKELPPLATRNLQTLTETVWYGPNTLNTIVPVEMSWKIDHYRLNVYDNWVKHYSHKWKTVGTTFYVDFGAVTV